MCFMEGNVTVKRKFLGAVGTASFSVSGKGRRRGSEGKYVHGFNTRITARTYWNFAFGGLATTVTRLKAAYRRFCNCCRRRHRVLWFPELSVTESTHSKTASGTYNAMWPTRRAVESMSFSLSFFFHRSAGERVLLLSGKNKLAIKAKLRLFNDALGHILIKKSAWNSANNRNSDWFIDWLIHWFCLLAENNITVLRDTKQWEVPD